MSEKDRIDLHGRSQGDFHAPIELIHSWKYLNEPFGIKDSYSRFIYANPAYLELLNLPKDFDIVGRLDSELPSSMAEFSEQILTHENLVKSTKERITSLVIHDFVEPINTSAYFFNAYPFIGTDGEVIGVFFNVVPAEELSIMLYTKFSDKLNRRIFIGDPPVSIKLTKREEDIVFLLMRGKSRKEISGILSKSIKYIENRELNIFSKLGVSTRKQFYDYGVSVGLLNWLPYSVLSKGYFILD
ncbi:helix-turn-helix transcriptional regulator [Yersinia enterocolitica]|nr:helix-turn-helix transcriptional regulator [Yersinia enterocolitica]ELI7924476.1 helix-turn-helix transcriptional regulator [Yersinia enterocolitica]